VEKYTRYPIRVNFHRRKSHLIRLSWVSLHRINSDLIPSPSILGPLIQKPSIPCCTKNYRLNQLWLARFTLHIKQGFPTQNRLAPATNLLKASLSIKMLCQFLNLLVQLHKSIPTLIWMENLCRTPQNRLTS
jgi:hypothetical protein